VIRFAVGYQLAEGGEEPFSDLIADYRDDISEVYFPWTDMASGRAALATRRGYTDWTAQRRLENDLVALREMGVRLDLLFNANCYAGMAISQFLANQVISLLDYLGDLLGGVDIVTTTSPFVAHVIRDNFGDIDVRASVNMRIGTVQSMEYVSHLFDSYYVLRDHNRDLSHIKRIKRWADAHGKGLNMLVNSGCLYACSGQTFHDNLVAHEREVDETAPLEGYVPHVCWNLYRDRANWPAILRSTWVRPEDIDRYEGLFGAYKLATRMHSKPRLVIDAYVRRSHHGNLLDLFEPGFGPAFAPYIVDNDRFPDDWFERTSTCGRVCESCDYCARVLDQVLVDVQSLI